MARPIQRFSLDPLGDGEQDHHHRRFRPLLQQQRAGWNAGMNGQPGQQWYGVSNPSQGDSGSVTR